MYVSTGSYCLRLTYFFNASLTAGLTGCAACIVWGMFGGCFVGQTILHMPNNTWALAGANNVKAGATSAACNADRLVHDTLSFGETAVLLCPLDDAWHDTCVVGRTAPRGLHGGLAVLCRCIV